MCRILVHMTKVGTSVNIVLHIIQHISKHPTTCHQAPRILLSDVIGCFCCRLNPVGEFYYDGSTINPFEVVFVAMNTLVVENNWSFARQAALYQEWLHLQVSMCIAYGLVRVPSDIYMYLHLQAYIPMNSSP